MRTRNVGKLTPELKSTLGSYALGSSISPDELRNKILKYAKIDIAKGKGRDFPLLHKLIHHLQNPAPSAEADEKMDSDVTKTAPIDTDATTEKIIDIIDYLAINFPGILDETMLVKGKGAMTALQYARDIDLNIRLETIGYLDKLTYKRLGINQDTLLSGKTVLHDAVKEYFKLRTPVIRMDPISGKEQKESKKKENQEKIEALQESAKNIKDILNREESKIFVNTPDKDGKTIVDIAIDAFLSKDHAFDYYDEGFIALLEAAHPEKFEKVKAIYQNLSLRYSKDKSENKPNKGINNTRVVKLYSIISLIDKKRELLEKAKNFRIRLESCKNSIEKIESEHKGRVSNGDIDRWRDDVKKLETKIQKSEENINKVVIKKESKVVLSTISRELNVLAEHDLLNPASNEITRKLDEIDVKKEFENENKPLIEILQ